MLSHCSSSKQPYAGLRGTVVIPGARAKGFFTLVDLQTSQWSNIQLSGKAAEAFYIVAVLAPDCSQLFLAPWDSELPRVIRIDFSHHPFQLQEIPIQAEVQDQIQVIKLFSNNKLFIGFNHGTIAWLDFKTNYLSVQKGFSGMVPFPSPSGRWIALESYPSSREQSVYVVVSRPNQLESQPVQIDLRKFPEVQFFLDKKGIHFSELEMTFGTWLDDNSLLVVLGKKGDYNRLLGEFHLESLKFRRFYDPESSVSYCWARFMGRLNIIFYESRRLILDGCGGVFDLNADSFLLNNNYERKGYLRDIQIFFQGKLEGSTPHWQDCQIKPFPQKREVINLNGGRQLEVSHQKNISQPK